MQTTLVKVSELNIYEKNPRLHKKADVDKMAAVLTANGFTIPILVCRENNTVVDGHKRLAAAQLIGLEEIPVVYTDIPLSEIDSLIVAQNSTFSAGWNKHLIEAVSKMDAALAEILALNEKREQAINREMSKHRREMSIVKGNKTTDIVIECEGDYAAGHKLSFLNELKYTHYIVCEDGTIENYILCYSTEPGLKRMFTSTSEAVAEFLKLFPAEEICVKGTIPHRGRINPASAEQRIFVDD